MATLTEKITITATVGDRVFTFQSTETTVVDSAQAFSIDVGATEEGIFTAFGTTGGAQPYMFLAVNRSPVNNATVKAEGSGGKDVNFTTPPGGSVDYYDETGVLNVHAGGTITATMDDATYKGNGDGNVTKLDCIAIYTA